MNLNLCGVYKITNTVTNEFYIGSSYNVQNRWEAHKKRHKSETYKEYDKLLYKKMREYGFDKFQIEILEKCDKNDLRIKERYHIKHLQSETVGYNISYGMENHNKAALTIQDVIDIRTRYNNKERKKEVYKDYSYLINKTGFHKVWNGYTWPEIMPEIYTEENKSYYKNDTANNGHENGMAMLNEQDVLQIRIAKKEGKGSKSVYKNYENRITYKSFLNTWYGYNWKHILVT